MGTKYPAGESPVYPPRDWTCPSCGKYHTKPHFAFPGQVDKKHRPGVEGRVKFNREGADMNCDDPKKYDTPIKVMKEATGHQFKQDGNHRPVFRSRSPLRQIQSDRLEDAERADYRNG